MQIPAEFLSITKEAAVLARGNTVVYANSAAESLLMTGCVGKSLVELFGDEIAAAQAGCFVAGTVLCGKSCSLRSMVLDGMHILVFSPTEVSSPELNSAFINAFNSSLMNMSLSLTNGFNLLDDEGENSAMRKCLTDIHRDYYRLRRLSSNIRIVGNYVSGSLPFVPKADDLSALCRRFFSALCDMYPNVDFKLSIPSSIVLKFDRSLVMSALTNLISNCLCHSGCDTISFSMIEAGTLVMFSVTDNGCGIPPELTATIFDRFKNSPALCGSSGLGLTAVRAAAERHCGTLLVESREGRGTSVRFSISTQLQAGRDFLSSTGADTFPAEELYTGLADVLPLEILI